MARVRDYKGPKKRAIELSEEDKKYIVDFYSKGIVENQSNFIDFNSTFFKTQE